MCLLPLLAVERRGVSSEVAPLTKNDTLIWVTLLGLCAAQYYTVLVADMPLHFHLSTVLLFAALTVIIVALVRGDVREGRLDFLVRFLSVKPGASLPAER